MGACDSGHGTPPPLHGATGCTDNPEPPNPTQIDGQLSILQAVGRRGIKPATSVRSPERYYRIEHEAAVPPSSKKGGSPRAIQVEAAGEERASREEVGGYTQSFCFRDFIALERFTKKFVSFIGIFRQMQNTHSPQGDLF